jgi:hypothetical protein
MIRFVLSLVLGIVVGSALTATAAIVAGDNGYLNAWTVTKGGEEVCSAPYIWVSTKEIECD